MHLLFHLSDLHIDPASEAQRVLFEVLIETLRREKEASKAAHFALVITGDVFDSSTMPAREAVPLFLDLHARIVAAVACPVPSIVLPGNHDRRWRGLVGPHRIGLFNALRDAVDPKSVYVAGCRFPFLAEVVPQSFHGLPADIVAYDSTYLPSGWVSAGGMIRQEDLLQVHAQLRNGPSDRPLIVLVHHHLIPTPVTDVSFINSGSSISRGLPGWLLGRALPTIVANADREELTMTALGAGTALSTLHSFGRAVLLLHGHKHFPTARLVRGLTKDSGDVLIASAGSGGRRERVDATHDPEAASLWPSFNVARMDGDRVEIEVVSFPSRHLSRAPARRDLAHVSRRDARWEAHSASAHVRDCAVPVALDEARFVLSPSSTEPDERWDYVCERRVQLFPNAKLRRYIDFAHGGAGVSRDEASAPRRRVALALNGVTRYRVANGLCRTVEVARRTYGTSTAFEWAGLLSRYGSATASICLARAHLADFAPFGSMTDLATGRETPAAVDATDDGWRLTIKDCAPRTFLRIYWPLSSETP